MPYELLNWTNYMLSMLGRIGHFTAPSGLLNWTNYMLSMLGRIGHFIAPSGLLNSTQYNKKICEDMQAGKNKDILLLIIPSQVHDIPHSKYKGSICFIYSIGPGFTGSRHDIRSFLVGLEFPCSGVCSILENFPQDQIAQPKHSRIYPYVIRVCQAALVGRYADCCCFLQLFTDV